MDGATGARPLCAPFKPSHILRHGRPSIQRLLVLIMSPPVPAKAASGRNLNPTSLFLQVIRTACACMSQHAISTTLSAASSPTFPYSPPLPWVPCTPASLPPYTSSPSLCMCLLTLVWSLGPLSPRRSPGTIPRFPWLPPLGLSVLRALSATLSEAISTTSPAPPYPSLFCPCAWLFWALPPRCSGPTPPLFWSYPPVLPRPPLSLRALGRAICEANPFPLLPLSYRRPFLGLPWCPSPLSPSSCPAPAPSVSTRTKQSTEHSNERSN